MTTTARLTVIPSICMTSAHTHTHTQTITEHPFISFLERELLFFRLSSLQLSNISLTFSSLFFTSSRLN
ncbi:hypothetical protein L2E82_10716 [Cichorium intybus]|uniref:Uncharacterized protein n=1 Tax=Cichorium intybus TaxID=13427 RepID=A0ACB9GB64_CICIN|nr:hypothetical protein L2E82_10716 [Cichorium intybus]